MTYQETIAWLYQRLPSYQNNGAIAYKENLSNITNFCEHLGNPQSKFKSIHVAGTNGKGSTSHMLASILQESGYKTGLHTSPHLKDFRERNRINGELMTQDFVVDFIQKHQEFIAQNHASFFEITLGMGFQYFAENNVDVAIIETGIGGRLDATNILQPTISVITNIGLDHTAILGETLHDIALEKAGIIKNKTPVVVGEVTAETKDAFDHKAALQDAPLYYAQDMTQAAYATDLKGLYQQNNIRTTIATVQILQTLDWAISEEHIACGLHHVSHNTGLRGRWDILQEKPTIIADTAHNAAGMGYIVKQIESTSYHQLHLVLGFVNDKDVKSLLNLFPQHAQFYFCEPDIPRKMPVEEIQKLVPTTYHAQYYKSVKEAFLAAKNTAQKDDFIFVGGSTFVVAEIL